MVALSLENADHRNTSVRPAYADEAKPATVCFSRLSTPRHHSGWLQLHSFIHSRSGLTQAPIAALMLTQIPGTCVTTRQASSALPAAASVSDKGVEVSDTPDLGHIVRVVGTHHRQRLTNCLLLLQHVQHLRVTDSKLQLVFKILNILNKREESGHQ